MTPDDFYEAYLKAEADGDWERMQELDAMAEEDEALKEACWRAMKEKIRRVDRWLDQGGRELMEQEAATRHAMYRRKIRQGEVPLEQTLADLARDCEQKARLLRLMGRAAFPALLETTLRRIEEFKIAYEVRFGDE